MCGKLHPASESEAGRTLTNQCGEIYSFGCWTSNQCMMTCVVSLAAAAPPALILIGYMITWRTHKCFHHDGSKRTDKLCY